MATEKRPAPADFRENAPVERNAQLAKRYGVSMVTIVRWRKETGIRGIDGSYQPHPVPENFAQIAKGMRLYEARIYFGNSDSVLKRWCAETGIRFRVSAQVISRATATPIEHYDSRDMSRAGMAADHLRRFGPVFRCDAEGRALPDGFFWRRGSFILSDDEIIERAVRLGWDENAWRMVAA